MADDRWTIEAYCEYYQLLYRVGRYLLRGNPGQIVTLEDHIQDVLLQMLKKKEKLQDHPNLKGWLVVTMKNELLSSRRKENDSRKRASYSLDNPDNPAQQEMLMDKELSPEFLCIDQFPERLDKIRELLGKDNTDLLIEAYVKGMPYAELASRLGIGETALRMRLYRLKEKVRSHPELFFVFAIFALLISNQNQ